MGDRFLARLPTKERCSCLTGEQPTSYWKMSYPLKKC